MFQTQQGPSFPAHQYLFGATSAPSAADDHNGIFAAENTAQPVGCAAPSTTRVPLIDPQGVEFTQIFPCFEHQTLADLLEARTRIMALLWCRRRHLAGSGSPRHLDGAEFDQAHLRRGRSDSARARSGPRTSSSPHPPFCPTFPPNCNLSGVSWVIPDALDSDHSWDVRIPPAHHGWRPSSTQSEPANARTLNGSSYWDSTAIIVTWDDWGGWYDHEPPTVRSVPVWRLSRWDSVCR